MAARRPTAERSSRALFAEDVEQCELCSAVVPSGHQHLLDTAARRLVCSCRACATLFSDATIGGRSLRLIPSDVRRMNQMNDADLFWAELGIPVDLAFFFYDTSAARTVALYPSPMGATESQLSLDAWGRFTAANPALASILPDVEALLVNRTKQRNEHWIAPIDACYTLAGIIRTNWKGLGGGDDVWRELDRFFDDLRARAHPT